MEAVTDQFGRVVGIRSLRPPNSTETAPEGPGNDWSESSRSVTDESDSTTDDGREVWQAQSPAGSCSGAGHSEQTPGPCVADKSAPIDSEPRRETTPSGGTRSSSRRDSGDMMVLAMESRAAIREVDVPYKLWKNNPVCRHQIRVGEVPLEACIDSGATLCMMSKGAYEKIKHIVGPLNSSDKRASGANGSQIEILGWAKVPFTLKVATYTFKFLVGDLAGVDCLLGLDWLHSVGATVDFGSMTAVLGPTERVRLTEQAPTYNFCSVKIGQTLMPRSHTRIRCRASRWNGDQGTDAVFEPGGIKLGPGLEISPGIVHVEKTGHFYVAVTNTTVEEREVPDQILIGRLEEIAIRVHRKVECPIPGEGSNRVKQPRSPPGLCLWTMVNHRLEPLSDMEERLWKPDYVKTSVVPESACEPPGVKPGSEKHYVRVVAARERSEPSSASPRRVDVYSAEGVKLDGQELQGTELLDFWPEDRARTEEVLFTDTSRASRHEPSRVERPESLGGYRRQTNVHRMPEHLRSVLPPPGTLTDFEMRRLVALIMEYQDVFVGPDGKVGYNSLVRHSIDTGDSVPYKCHPRKKSLVEKEYVRKEVQKLLKEGFIKPSTSPWGASVVLAKKKDGSLRFCIDYRKLNDLTKKDAYPLPRIEECLDALNGCLYFCTMDLASGYWQVAMNLEDVEKTAFTTHVGLYEWNVMPFGLCNAPATFSRMMEMVLSDIVWKECLVYLDDVISFGRTYDATLQSLRAVMMRLRAHNLKLKPSKCEFFRTQVEYLGHEVGQQGIRPSLSKIQALHDWKLPTDLTQLKSFLGFTGFYRRFIRGYAELAKPLTEKTKGGPQKRWEPMTGGEIAAFEAVLKALSERVLLHYVIPGEPFYLVTDASNYAIGGVLEHRPKGEKSPLPLAFASKTLEESRTRYCATKKELYAVVFFMRYFLGYYRGTKIYIETDHYALQWLMGFDLTDSMYHRWITELGQYHPWEIKHRPGADNVAADALSRKNKPEATPKRSPRPYKDCTVPKCEICSYHFRKNRRCLDSDSDSEDSEEDPDRPDRHDHALWELMLTRANNDPRVLHLLAVTRSRARERNNQRNRDQPPRRSQRVAAQRAAKRAAEASEKADMSDVSDSEPVRSNKHWRKKHRDRERHVKHQSLRRSERRVARRSLEPIDSGYSSGCSGEDSGGETTSESPPDVTEVPTGVETSSGYPPEGGSKASVEPSRSPAVEKVIPPRDTELSTSKDSNPTERSPCTPMPDIESATEDGLRAILDGHSDRAWVEAQEADPVIARLLWFLRNHEQKPETEAIKGESEAVQSLLTYWSSFEFHEGILCRVVIKGPFTIHEPRIQRLVPLKWRLDLWKEIHKSAVRHLAYEKVYDMLFRDYFWYNMSHDVMDWGRACLTCQKTKPGIGRGIEQLKQEYVCRRGERVAMDLVGPLPCTEDGFRYILVMQDYYTKWVQLTAIKNKKAVTVAFAFLQCFVANWGCPETLHSDQGNEFDAAVFREMCEVWGIRKTRTTPFNPSSNGMVERSNRTMISLLRNMGDRMYMTTWDRKLPLAMIAMNTAVHSTTGFAPFKLQVAGCEDMRMPHHLLYGKPRPLNVHCLYDEVFTQALAMQEIAEQVRLKTGKALAAQRAARERGPLKIYDYKIGDLVLRYYPPYASQKLHHSPYDGPLEVVELDRENRKVKLKDLQAKGGGTEDKWVHVSALKPVIRTEEGLILALYDGVKLKEVPSAMDPGPKYSNRPLPLVAEFSEFGLYASCVA